MLLMSIKVVHRADVLATSLLAMRSKITPWLRNTLAQSPCTITTHLVYMYDILNTDTLPGTYERGSSIMTPMVHIQITAISSRNRNSPAAVVLQHLAVMLPFMRAQLDLARNVVWNTYCPNAQNLLCRHKSVTCDGVDLHGPYVR